MVRRGGLVLTAIGLAIGVAGAVALARWLSSLLFHVPAYDPVTLSIVSLALRLTAAAACLVPARRARRVSPIIALKAE